MQTQLRCVAVFLLTLVVAGVGIPAGAQAQEVLGHEAYEIWRTIGNRDISPDGAWVHYTLNYEDEDGLLVVRQVDTAREHRVERGASPSFTTDGARVVFRISPHQEAVEEHRENRNRGQQPRDSLGVLELASGEITRIAHVQSHRVPAEAPEWLVVHHHPGDPDETDEERAGEGEAAHGALVLHSLATGAWERFSHVTSFQISDNGALLAFVDDPPGDDVVGGLRVMSPGTDGVTTVMEAPGAFRGLGLDDEGGQLAFLHAAEPDEGDEPDDAEDADTDEQEAEHILFHWRTGEDAPRAVAETGTPGIPTDWWVSRWDSPSFSDSGRRLFFGTAPHPTRPEADPEWSHPLDDDVDVEVWHWQDEELMTVQNVRRTQELRRNYQAVLFLDEDRVVQLADEDLPVVNVGSGGDADVAVGIDGRPYALMGSWESPNYRDQYLVDVTTGERQIVEEMSQGTGSISPEERFMTWYEPADSAWYARELETGQVRNLSDAIGHPVYNEEHDRPMPAGSYGSAGWLDDDEGFLIYDRYDLWAVDPAGQAEPYVVTRGEGRAQMIRFRLIGLDWDEPAFPRDHTVLLSAFHDWEKDAGFYRTTLDGEGSPERLLMESRSFSTPTRAEDADRLLFSQETFQEFPDLWVSDMEFEGRTRVSEANPQQADYRWGTTELVEWTSTDGDRLQGVLMKPDDFDPSREYPMVVYFYERWSDGLHNHYAPVPHRSRISFPMYTSHDYLVFIPDVVYRIGYPGEGAMNSIVPGVHHLLDRGFVDRDRIALQGHSWGGYQIAFMVTRSRDLFVAGAAGAPVANMISAYGGIRRQTGLVRQFQYERTQSRLGGSLWEMPMRYIENSPLFWVDKIETPLLIMHNDADGHVPWEQGIELFVAMRRLGKPAWMINYRGEPHWPTTFANRRDWNIRMMQFFDHFLKDAPPPTWMVEGIPAVLRGETLGYETVEGASVVDGGDRDDP